MNPSEESIKDFQAGKLTVARLNELVDAINILKATVNTLVGKQKLDAVGKSLSLPCKITDTGPAGRYYADCYLPPYRPDDTPPLAADDLLARTQQVILWNLGEIGGSEALAVDDMVMASTAGFDPSGYPLMIVGSAGGDSGTLFPVVLTSDGGSAGSSTAVCSLTYSVYDWATGTILLADSVRPAQQSNYDIGNRIPANVGQAFWDGDTLVLFCFEELSAAVGCS